MDICGNFDKSSDLTSSTGFFNISLSCVRKLDLVRLCEAAEEIGIELDPDCLLEDREEILKGKSTTHDNEMYIKYRYFSIR
jgi:hypothetical protein